MRRRKRESSESVEVPPPVAAELPPSPQRHDGPMPPWELLPFYQTTAPRTIAVPDGPGPALLLASADPNRVMIAFAVAGFGFANAITPDPNGTNGIGIVLNTSVNWLVMHTDVWGPWVQGPWYVIPAKATSILVLETALKKRITRP